MIINKQPLSEIHHGICGWSRFCTSWKHFSALTDVCGSTIRHNLYFTLLTLSIPFVSEMGCHKCFELSPIIYSCDAISRYWKWNVCYCILQKIKIIHLCVPNQARPRAWIMMRKVKISYYIYHKTMLTHINYNHVSFVLHSYYYIDINLRSKFNTINQIRLLVEVKTFMNVNTKKGKWTFSSLFSLSSKRISNFFDVIKVLMVFAFQTVIFYFIFCQNNFNCY